MNKTNLTIISIAISVLIIGIIVGAGGFASPQFSPKDEPDQPFINANECTRDGVCEVNAISTYNPSRTVNIENANLTVNSGYGGIRAGSLYVIDEITSLQIKSNALTTFGDAISYRAMPQILIANTSIYANYLKANSTSTGNAYVCVNNIGFLYRSTAPCV